MYAVIATDFNTEPRLAELPVPEPGPGEVLVRLAAAGVNPFDSKVVEGILKGQVEHAFPMVLGADGAGIVELTGPGVTAFAPGDRVFGQFMDIERGRGSYAEYAVAPAEGKLALLPEELPYDLAAAIPTACAGAHDFVAGTGVGSGDTLLINGASGGVGQVAIQLADAKDVRVLATTPPDTADYLRELGAVETYDFTAGPVSRQVRAAHPDGIDAVLDLFSGGTGETGEIADVLRPGGTVVSSNTAVDPEAMAARGLRGLNLYGAATPETLDLLAEAVRREELKVHIDHRAGLAEAWDALERLRLGKARGKTVLTVQDRW
ncbi:NADP-dependent oxidoreductase [Glycomyces xiaoerkulensis]|uniref:NADP-dependent oxidoreductase n=1 Tax=Glycomyces xiaoerkulensis TaxID=2038139 RepID=UPI0018E47637|nr:NADP-dependent oxidoreductase [Glycomyces xiaoerkulensis]